MADVTGYEDGDLAAGMEWLLEQDGEDAHNIFSGFIEYMSGSLPVFWGGAFYLEPESYSNAVDILAEHQPYVAEIAADNPQMVKSGVTLAGIAVALDGGRRIYNEVHEKSMSEAAREYYRQRRQQLPGFLR